MSSALEVADNTNLKILTWNILNTPHQEGRLDALYRKVRSYSPDILTLQEVIFSAPDGGSPEEVERAVSYIENATGMKAVPSVTTAYHPLHRLEFGNLTLYNPHHLISHPLLGSAPADIETPHAPPLWTFFTDVRTGTDILIANVHLAFGAGKTLTRYLQLYQANLYSDQFSALLTSQSSSKKPLVIIAGDYNTTPDSDPIRYMKGLTVPAFLAGSGPYDESKATLGTFWVDVWDHLRPGEPGHTSRNEGSCAQETALSRGLQASMIPSRRIDYIFVKGWVYGANGTPLSAELVGGVDSFGTDLSDHHGLFSTLMLK